MKTSPRFCAFTLVELLVATTIGGMLAGMAVVTLTAAQRSIRATERLAAQAWALRSVTAMGLLWNAKGSTYTTQYLHSSIATVSFPCAALASPMDFPVAGGTSYPTTVRSKIVDLYGVGDPVPVTAISAVSTAPNNATIYGAALANKKIRTITTQTPVVLTPNYVQGNTTWPGQDMILVDLKNRKISRQSANPLYPGQGASQKSFTSTVYVLDDTAISGLASPFDLLSSSPNYPTLYYGSMLHWPLPLL